MLLPTSKRHVIRYDVKWPRAYDDEAYYSKVEDISLLSLGALKMLGSRLFLAVSLQ